MLGIAIDKGALKLLACVEKAAHDRPFRDAHDLGHLFVAEAIYFAHNDDRAMVGGESIERRRKALCQFTAIDDVGGIRAIDPTEKWEIGFTRVIAIETLFVERCPDGSPGLSNEVDAEVGDDTVEPREEA